MLRKLITKLWPFLLISTVVFAFFGRLFFPPSMFVTPDFGRSDLIHFNIPMRLFMSESLKQFQLPLWNQNIGQGFPVLDEGQIGVFYPPNFILFSFLPFWLAFNLGYLVTFLISAIGTYFFARSIKITKSGAVLSSIIFTFCPVMVLHLHHYNLIQSVSLFPWLLLFTNKFLQTKKINDLIIFSLIVALQIFVGFPQIVAYSILGCFVFVTYQLLLQKIKWLTRIKFFTFFILAVILSLAITFVQLTSMYRLSIEAKRTTLLDPQKVLTEFPFKGINLLTVINPFIQGNPKIGTYPVFQRGEWGIFWENTTYVGIVPLIFSSAVTLSIFKIKNKKIKQLIGFWFFFGLLGVTLSLGNSAPLHPLFSFPPFSLFRVPSRFLVFSFIAAAILSGIFLDKVQKIKNPKIRFGLTVFLFVVVVGDIFKTWYNFPLIGPIKTWLNPPQLSLKISSNGRLLSYGMEEKWDELFNKSGWSRDTEYYNFLRNFNSEDANLQTGLSQSNVYAGMITYRQAITSLIIKEFMKKSEKGLKIEDPSQQLINANNISYITTPTPINSENWELIDSVKYKDNQIYLYKNLQSKPRVYIAYSYQVANTNQEFRNIVLAKDSNIAEKIVLEEVIDLGKPQPKNTDTAEITKSENTKVEIEAQLSQKSLVVLSDSYYPGWKAYIDNQETKIYPANVNSRALIVPEGNHKIKFIYQPVNFQKELLISAGFLIATFVVLLRSKLKLKFF